MRLAFLTLAIAATLGPGLQAAPKRAPKKAVSRPIATTPEGEVHLLRKGETAAAVGRLYDLTMPELAALNPGKNLSKLSVGARIVINRKPPAEPGAPAATAPLRLPLAALPGTPIVAPAPMPHLERLLPYQIRAAQPTFGARGGLEPDPHQSPATSAQLLARLQPVMAPVSEAELRALLPTYAPADPARLDLLWPVETRTISSGWGPRMRTRTVRVKDQRKKRVRYKGSHRGLDLNAPTGTAVFAAMDGEVLIAGRHKQYGNYVVVDHGNGVVTLYAHHRLNLVQAGLIVRRGQKIAEVGRTGNATGPHLHFELKVHGVQRNPLPVLNDEEEIPAEMATFNELIGTGTPR